MIHIEQDQQQQGFLNQPDFVGNNDNLIINDNDVENNININDLTLEIESYIPENRSLPLYLIQQYHIMMGHRNLSSNIQAFSAAKNLIESNLLLWWLWWFFFFFHNIFYIFFICLFVFFFFQRFCDFLLFFL